MNGVPNEDATKQPHAPLPRDVHPFIKWAGGKRSLAAEVVKRLPSKPFMYGEPFLGGGAVFFELYKRGLLIGAALADSNEELINAFVVVRDHPDRLIAKLERHAALYGEEHYYATRAKRDATDGVERAARFIFLNRTCFNGLHRVNAKGEFNVPWGRYVNPRICDRENIAAAAVALERAALRCVDFEESLERAPVGSVVYCDPPYLPVKKTSFVKYVSGGFGLEHHAKLSSAARAAAARGVRVVVSNSDLPEIRTLYTGSLIETVRAPRAVNSDGKGRGEVNELLITVKP